MPNLFDRLSDIIGDDDNDNAAGITPLDIADLPDDQRRVMFRLLRESKASSVGITLDALYERLGDIEDLEAVLAELTKHQWLIRLGEPPEERYKINLRRRRGSAAAGGGLWATLSDHLSHLDDPDNPDQ